MYNPLDNLCKIKRFFTLSNLVFRKAVLQIPEAAEENKFTPGVFIDMSKFFDTVDLKYF